VSDRDERTDGDRPDGDRADGDRTDGERTGAGRSATDGMGDLLPDVTRDESAGGWGDDESDSDERLRREVPPHHG